jgi:hypothetical protein
MYYPVRNRVFKDVCHVLSCQEPCFQGCMSCIILSGTVFSRCMSWIILSGTVFLRCMSCIILSGTVFWKFMSCIILSGTVFQGCMSCIILSGTVFSRCILCTVLSCQEPCFQDECHVPGAAVQYNEGVGFPGSGEKLFFLIYLIKNRVLPPPPPPPQLPSMQADPSLLHLVFDLKRHCRCHYMSF